METVTLTHLDKHPLHLALFRNVQNSRFLRQQLLDGNASFEYAFLDASLLLSRKHALLACFRAINDQINGRLKTRNVHSEIVFAMSPNNNIAESFRRFGIQDETKDLVAIKVGGDRQSIQDHLYGNVQGDPVQLTNEGLLLLHDTARIRKVYRLEAPKRGETNSLGNEAEDLVFGSMALKGS